MPFHNVGPPAGAGAQPWTGAARQGAARSPSGSIRVVTTERGLPVALDIDPRELKKSPQQLADDILALCRLAAMRAQVEHRRELKAQGYDSSVLDDLKLATEAALADADEAVLGDGELPDTWMRSV